MKAKQKTISNHFIETICARLADNKQVRRSLPDWGRVHIDRQLPFLCIFRRPHDDNTLSERLVMSEASYLTTTGNRQQHKQLSLLIKRIAETLKTDFGSFLIVEIWMAKEDAYNELPPYKPAFKIIHPKRTAISSTIETLEKSLTEIKISKSPAVVEIVFKTNITPPGLPSLLTSAEAKEAGCHIIGIEVRHVFKDTAIDEIFPLIRRELQRKLSRALKYCFFEFTHEHTSQRPLHYKALGRWSVVKAVWDVDRQLAKIFDGFDFFLQVTPTNSEAAWSFFKRNRYDHIPRFAYRPLSIDPVLAKRQLFRIPIEHIEDPTLAQLFREQQLELDRKLTMLIDRGTPRFKYGSLQLYGTIDEALLKQAFDLLEKIPPHSRDESSSHSVDAETFAARARQELDYFQSIYPDNPCQVMIREDITGLMVSQGNLLIGAQLKVPTSRIDALIQHEVGTHVLTYLNGKAQPLHQLYIGLPGYDELQEGLAVLAEYLVGGLTRPRLRLLAARVVAAHNMIQGASFIDVFRELNTTHGFDHQNAFNVTVRTFRGGGLTKDAIYLWGLIRLLDYLKKGGALEPLLVGKISAAHVPIINELQWRNVLQPAPLLPRYLNNPQTNDKLNRLRKGINVLHLITRSKK